MRGTSLESRSFAIIETGVAAVVPDAEYKRLLGFPPHYVLEGRVAELVQSTRRWFEEEGRPWIYALPVKVEAEPEGIRLDETLFVSKILEKKLIEARAERAVLALVSAGEECETRARQLWQEGKPDEYFFTEVYGSAVVEALVTRAGARICAWAEENGMRALPHYSPGYPGWDICEQSKLFEVARQSIRRNLPGPLQVLESGMLQPKKSLIALFPVTSQAQAEGYTLPIPCSHCSYHPCQYRRLPYALAQLSEPTASAESVPANGSMVRGQQPRPEPHGKYSVNLRALRKWSTERLRIEERDNGTIRATFRYDGTTCSNLGQPLAFDYKIDLTGPQDGYRILETQCQPAPGDAGHTQMCEYLNHRERLMQAIGKEKPLAGKPLGEVLEWRRAPHPAACYCDAESRTHKWGLVLEVLHYALAARISLKNDTKDLRY